MKKAYFCVVITALLFGTMEVACKIGGSSLDPFQLTFLRFLIGGCVLLPFAITHLKRNKIRINGKDLLSLAGVGFLGVTVSMSMFQFSIMMCNASTVSVLICVNPFFTMVFAHFFTSEKLDAGKLGILAVALTGIFFMFRPWDIQEGNTALGMGLMIGAAFVFGLYTVAGKQAQRKIGLMAQTSISFLFGSGFLLVIMLILDRPIIDGVSGNIPVILYAGIMVTGVGYFFYFKAIELADASTGAFAFFLKPAIAPIIAVIVLKETILWNTVVGIAFVLAASLLNILHQKRESHRKYIEDHRKMANSRHRLKGPENTGPVNTDK